MTHPLNHGFRFVACWDLEVSRIETGNPDPALAQVPHRLGLLLHFLSQGFSVSPIQFN